MRQTCGRAIDTNGFGTALGWNGIGCKTRARVDVQNIDLMNLAGFCRNCLSRWYQEAAQEAGLEMGKDEARELFYGMTMEDWKTNFQTEANSKQQADFKTAFAENVSKEA